MAIQYTTGRIEAPEFCVPAGEYILRVIEAKEDTSKSGNDMIKLKLRVIHEDGREGPALFDYLVFSETSFWKVDAFLASSGHYKKEGQNMELDTDEMIGWQVFGRLSVSSFNGKKSNKVDAYVIEKF